MNGAIHHRLDQPGIVDHLVEMVEAKAAEIEAETATDGRVGDLSPAAE